MSNPEDFEFIKNLFARGAQDYLSVDLWAQYLACVLCICASHRVSMAGHFRHQTYEVPVKPINFMFLHRSNMCQWVECQHA